jgi:hypothetical protein
MILPFGSERCPREFILVIYGTNYRFRIYACLPPYFDARAQTSAFADADLSAYYDMILNSHTAAEARLRRDNNIPSYGAVVSNMYKVVYLGPRSDSGTAKPSVDT